MTVTLKDGLFTFGSQEIVEVPPTMNISGAYPGDIATTNDATQKAPLGTLYRHKGNVYRYVLFENGANGQQTAVAAVAGGVVHWYSLDPANGLFTVTSAYAAAKGKNLLAGVLLGVVTQGYYTWIQVGGVALLAGVDASTAAGEIMIYSSTNQRFGRCAVDAALVGLPFGVALAVDAPTNFGPVLLHNMIW
jgi:hypothetical protein